MQNQLLEMIAVKGLHEELFRVLASLDIPRSSKMLDIGCGTGAWLERLFAAGYHDLTGVSNSIKSCRSTHAKLIELDLDHEDARIPEVLYDVITAIEVVEHIQNPGNFAAFIKKHLSPSGIALISTPNIHSLHARLRWFITGRMPSFDDKGEPTHIYPVLFNKFSMLLHDHGLAVERVWSFPPRGGAIYRRTTGITASVLRRIIPDPFPGDVLCMTVRHMTEMSGS